MSAVKHRASAHRRSAEHLNATPRRAKLKLLSARTATKIALAFGLLLVLTSQPVFASTATTNPFTAHHKWWGHHHHKPKSPSPGKSGVPVTPPASPTGSATSTAPSSSAPSSSAPSSSAPASSSAAPSPSNSSTSAGVTPPPSSSAPAPSSSAPGSAVKGCVSSPSSCGYPDASNTGYPASMRLIAVPAQQTSGPGWHWDSRGWVEVDGDNAVFSGFSVTTNVDVTGNNVVISNNRIAASGDGFGVSLRHTKNAIISHNTIASPSAGTDRLMVAVKNIYGDESGTQVIGNNISHVSTGVQIDSGLIQDNYIHDMGIAPGDHINGITSNSSNGLLTIKHNTVLNQFDQTDAISLFEDFGAQVNRVIDSNLVAGGGYTIYGGANPGGAATSNIRITNNRFARLYYAQAGYFGSATAFSPSGSGNVWSGNIWDDSGSAVNY
jgi:hypothetical protein